MYMTLCRKFLHSIMFVILVVFGLDAMAQGYKKVGKIEDLPKPELETLKEIYNIAEGTDTKLKQMENENLASPVRNLNKGLQNATRDIKRALSEFEETYSTEAQSRLLDSMSEIYAELLSNIDEIPIDFLDHARDVYGNATSKGQRIAKENLKRVNKDRAYKEKLLQSKAERLRSFREEGPDSSQISHKEAERLMEDIDRIDGMLRKVNISANLYKKMEEGFRRIEQEKIPKIDGLEISIMAFNQLRADIQGEKDIIDQMAILEKLDEFTTEQFESSVDDVMRLSDNLFNASEAVFDNVFENLLHNDAPTEDTSGDSVDDDFYDRIDAILSRYD